MVLAVLLALSACGPTAGGGNGSTADATPSSSRFGHELLRPPGARWQMVEQFDEDQARERHSSDGGGRAWLSAGGPVPRGEYGSWTVEYEAGPEGIAVGGMITFQVPPFWNWGQAQGQLQAAPGYTTATTDAEGVELEIRDGHPEVFAVVIGGRALASGERVTFTYGAGGAGVQTDRYAERRSVFWIGVDGDGDGIRELLADSPAVDVLPGPPAMLVATLSSRARPGDAVRLDVAVLDASGSADVEVSGPIRFLERPAGVSLPEALTLEPGHRGVLSFEFPAPAAGIWRLTLEGPEGLRAVTNPLVVRDTAEPLLWADLHGHSNLSDGTGLPEDYFRYARDVAALDVVALTDHDHWGMRFLDSHPELQEQIREQATAFHEPGRFVTLHGYEWTSWIHGHRHVLSFDDGIEMYSSMDPDYRTPGQLWAALAGQPALTFAHHSAGGPIPTDWSWRPDPLVEPVTEIVSVHGSSESADTPGRIYNFERGNAVRDVLDDGMRFGFVGSGDSHDGHPGLSHIASPQGGLAALLTGDLSREGVLEVLRARRTYATNGPRIVLDVELDGAPMGATLTTPTPGHLSVSVAGTAALERIELIRGGVRPGAVFQTLQLGVARDAERTWQLPDLAPGEYLYVRVVQVDGGAAWSSPFYFDGPEATR